MYALEYDCGGSSALRPPTTSARSSPDATSPKAWRTLFRSAPSAQSPVVGSQISVVVGTEKPSDASPLPTRRTRPDVSDTTRASSRWTFVDPVRSQWAAARLAEGAGVATGAAEAGCVGAGAVDARDGAGIGEGE